MAKEIIYFDHAASTPMVSDVIDAMASCMRVYHGNPSSTHIAGRRARVILESARRRVAKHLGVSPSEIFFTSGGTEANNAILWGCCKDLGRKNIITSHLEHPAVLKTVHALKNYLGANVFFVPHDACGHIDLGMLDKLLQTHGNVVVALMHANNEIGNLLPVKSVADMCHTYGALFHSDMVQTIGKYPLDLAAHRVDFAAASAHKFHGPKGIGFMYVANGKTFQPYLTGGGQERHMRAGTENLCGIVGLAEALDWSIGSLSEGMAHIEGLKSYLIQALTNEIPGTVINGDSSGHSLYSIVNFSLPPDTGAGMLIQHLDMAGICVSSGSACASGASIDSHVLNALGVNPDIPSVRVSFSSFNTLNEVRRFVDVLKTL
jgi:cysteine desulfurase